MANASQPRRASPLLIPRSRPAFSTLRGWAIGVLIEAHAIAECQEHGHMRDHSDPHAWDHARDIARTDPFLGSSPDETVTAIDDIMNGIGDTCPECK